MVYVASLDAYKHQCYDIWEFETVFLFEIVFWLYSNKKRLIAEDAPEFEFPDYAGMPKELSDKLSPDLVDRIQDVIPDLRTAGSFKDYMRYFVFTY